MLIKTTLKELENTLFTADTHWAHKQILGYTNRPFSNVESMNENLVAEWNKRANDKTIIYHLGDVTLGGKEMAQEFFGQVNGQIRILENIYHHDKRWLHREIYYSKTYAPVQILPPMVVLEVTDYYDTGWPLPITLNHFAMRVWDRSHYSSYMLFGHSHNTLDYWGLSLDVGVDSAYKLLGEYAPFTFSQIDDIMRGRKNNNG